MAAALALAERGVRWPRLAGIAFVAASVAALHAQPAAWVLGAALLGATAVAVVEQRTLPAPARLDHAPGGLPRGADGLDTADAPPSPR
jgi:hypothetical protein